MIEIVPSLIWLADGLEVRDLELISKMQIDAVVDLAYEETPISLGKSKLAIRVPLIDGEGNNQQHIRLAITYTAELIRSKTPFVIACSAGISRSPTILAAALSTVENISIEEELAFILTKKRIGSSTVFLADVQDAMCSMNDDDFA